MKEYPHDLRPTAAKWLRGSVSNKVSFSYCMGVVGKLNRSHLLRMTENCIIICINKGLK